MPRESLDAPEDLPKQAARQVALGQLPLLNRTVLPICSIEVSPHGDLLDEQKGSAAGRAAQGRAGRTPHECARSEGVPKPRAASNGSREGTLHDRLTSELRLRGISTLEGGNAFLPEFLADFTRRFARPPADATPAWRPVPRDLAGAARARAVEVFQRLNALDPAAVAAEELTPEAVLRVSACYAPRDRGERPQRANTSLRSTPIAPLEVGDFVRPSVLLQGGIGVTDQDDLLEIIRQKASDRTGLLVLVHVTELMR